MGEAGGTRQRHSHGVRHRGRNELSHGNSQRGAIPLEQHPRGKGFDRAVLAELESFWREHAVKFKDVPHKPTYRLAGGGQCTGGWARRWDRWRRDWLR
jgi:hypothetical protein